MHFPGAGGAHGHGHGMPKRQDPPVVHDLSVTLEEIYKGCTKKMKITRTVTTGATAPRQEEKVLSIHVKPGWKAGTKVTFPKEGDQRPNCIPADVIFVVKDRPHATFKREQSDLKFTAKISLKDALCGTTIHIPTLDKTTVPLALGAETIKPSTVKRIHGQGLPLPKSPDRRGDLIINFEIQFPEHLTAEQKQLLKEVLP